MFLLELNEERLSSGNERISSLLLHLLRRNCKHIQHFRDYLSHHICNRWGWRDFCICLEAYEEVFNLVEEFNKHISACSRVPRRLCMVRWCDDSERDGAEQDISPQEEY